MSEPDPNEAILLRALTQAREAEDPRAFADALADLAAFDLSRDELVTAEQYAFRAATIHDNLGPSGEPWHAYNLLVHIYQALGKPDEAAQWRRREQDRFGVFAGAMEQLPQWAESFITVAVAAVQGDSASLAELQGVLGQMEATPDWYAMARIVRLVLAGERDFELLRVNLAYDAAYIVRAILAQLAGLPTEEEDDGPPVSLEGFFKLVEQACRPDAPVGLNAQLQTATLGMTQQMVSPPEIKALGFVLNAILRGEREPDLSGLAAPLAAKTRALLTALANEQ